MGNRAECPACKAYSSTILEVLNSGRDCPFCGCPNNLLVEWDQMQPELEELREKKISSDLLKRFEELSEENAKLKTKIHKMEDLLAWKDIEDIFGPILKLKKILEDNDERNDYET